MFCLFYVIHAILREHPYELFVFAFSVLVLLIYCVSNFAETFGEGLDIVKLASKQFIQRVDLRLA